MAWVQFYKVNQDVITSFVEGTGPRDFLPKALGYPALEYKYIDGATFFGEKGLSELKEQVSKELAFEAKRAMDALVRNSDDFVEFSKKISEIDFSKKSNEELAEIFADFVQSFKALVGLSMLPVFFDPLIEERLRKDVGKIFDPEKNPAEFEKTLKALIDLKEETFGAKEKRKLLEIAIEIEKNPELKKAFEKGKAAEIKGTLKD